jgi:DNA-binding transcriptional regulator LsrR (DeoR family)
MDEKQWLMAQVARMYYMDELTQEAIAKKLHFSRSTVSRLLMEARRDGIVKIEIRFPWQQDARLEYNLCKRYRLNDARVLITNGLTTTEILQGIGALGGRYLRQVLIPGMVIALSTGATTFEMIKALEPRPELACTVVQVMGVINPHRPNMDGAEHARQLAARLGGTHYSIHSPLIVEDCETRDSLLQTPTIRQAVELAGRANIAIVGVGTLNPDNSSLVQEGHLQPDELRSLVAAGAVGEVAGCAIGPNGEAIRTALTGRVVTMGLDRLKGIPLVVGIAGGAVKARALQAALRGGIFDVLITDSSAARALLEEPEPA